MTAILKVDTIQDTSGNNIINENANTITIGKSGDTVNLASGATNNLGITMADQWRLTSNKTNVGTSDTTIDSNLERIDTSGQNTIGTAMSESSGVFTFPSTGVYYVRADMVFTKDASRRAVYVTIRSGSTDLSQSYSHINPPTGDDAFASVSASTYFNVANTTNDTIYFRGTNVGGGDVNALGSTTKNLTTFTFIRLGDN